MNQKPKEPRETARVSMPDSLYEKLKERSAKEMISMSAIIRQAIKKHLKNS